MVGKLLAVAVRMALIDHVPPELEAAADEELGDPALMSPARMREWIRQRKAG